MKRARISGGRIKQARELRGYTQVDFADRIGVKQPTVARYEKGFKEPAEETLSRIAIQTGFPLAFFRLPEPSGIPLGTHLLFRAKASATKHEQVRAHRHAEVIYEAIESLAVDVNLIKPKVPRLEETPARSAVLARAMMGIPPDKPIDNLVRVIERAGARVLALPLTIENVDAFSFWSSGDGEIPVIAVLGGAPGDRLRWSVAHELGHLVLHGALKCQLREAEKQADEFAAEFLMPEDGIRQELVTPVTLFEVAKLKPRWKVSMAALARRARALGIITERQYAYLFTQMSARRWRVREPDNLDIAIERPRLLRKMLEVLSPRAIDYAKLAARLYWSEQFAQEIVEQHAERNDSFRNDVSAKGDLLKFRQQKPTS